MADSNELRPCLEVAGAWCYHCPKPEVDISNATQADIYGHGNDDWPENPMVDIEVAFLPESNNG